MVADDGPLMGHNARHVVTPGLCAIMQGITNSTKARNRTGKYTRVNTRTKTSKKERQKINTKRNASVMPARLSRMPRL